MTQKVYSLDQAKKIFIAGHRGLVGSGLVRALRARGLGSKLILKTRQELNLVDERAVLDFYRSEKPDAVIIAAARVGGIHANSTYPVEFLTENLRIELNLIQGAAESGVNRLLFLGSTCIYPKHAPQPIHEDSLLTGPLEPTNEAYALAKICGLKLCEYQSKQYGRSFISAMPTNLYGPGDNFHPENSHVIPGMMRRFHEEKLKNAASVTIWGTGTPLREFLHVDDLAQGCLTLMEFWNHTDWVNIGSGAEVSIRQLAETMATITGFSGRLEFDTTKPDGTPRKITDISRIREIGWNPKIALEEGLRSTYQWAIKNNVFNTN